jgi:hypothetical protein
MKTWRGCRTAALMIVMQMVIFSCDYGYNDDFEYSVLMVKLVVV